MRRGELWPTFNGQWEVDFETEEGSFCLRVPDATLRRHFQAELERRGIPTERPEELIKVANCLEERQFPIWRAMQQIDYWRQCHDPEAHFFQYGFPSRPTSAADAED